MLIGELAKISGLSKDGIRHYERMGIISSNRRQAGSRWYNDYDESVLGTIEKVRQGQRLGLPLKEIKHLLKVYEGRDLTKSEAIVFLKERLKVIREKIANLHEVEDYIVRKLNRYKKR